MVNCPVCNGPGLILGTLVTAWYRCRDCGITFMDDAIDQDPGWDDNTTEAIARAIGLIN
jgi:transcription initiation factor TFIIIB Brf1 subunit/transcription initiation factor TFIIB